MRVVVQILGTQTGDSSPSCVVIGEKYRWVQAPSVKCVWGVTGTVWSRLLQVLVQLR